MKWVENATDSNALFDHVAAIRLQLDLQLRLLISVLSSSLVDPCLIDVHDLMERRQGYVVPTIGLSLLISGHQLSVQGSIAHAPNLLPRGLRSRYCESRALWYEEDETVDESTSSVV